MAKSKRAAQSTEPGFLEKITDQVSHLKEAIIEGKDQMVEAAGGALESIKEKMHDLRGHNSPGKKKKVARKKPVIKKAVKKATGKAIRKTARKSARPAAGKKVAPKKTRTRVARKSAKR